MSDEGSFGRRSVVSIVGEETTGGGETFTYWVCDENTCSDQVPVSF